ncbi:SDR family NAD(P)-dependent oxidoreductase [Brevibacterium oceani]|uniref:SDR family NAD(P)-dependent oxidoreductase n=1 Tax=Brevibacterium oceani TaxID=358099 RepID=UPI001B31FE6B|nr:SDR family NAD(P)-dependent oxidoreductase [Brevibacterium oceani]
MSTILITGGHSGIGLAAVRNLARLGHDLILAGRSVTRMQPVRDEIAASHGIDVSMIEVDMSSLASVRTVPEQLATLSDTGTLQELDALVCNAGGRFDGEITYSPEGYEMTFATNYLGNVLLIDLLTPFLAEHGRIIITASGTHDRDSTDGKMVGAAVEPDAFALAYSGRDGRTPLSAGKRYSTSKLCTIMHIYELDRRLRQQGSTVHAIAYDPGLVPGTGFLRDMPKIVRRISRTALVTRLSSAFGGIVSDVEFSGRSLAALAVEPQFAERTGEYFQANLGALTAVRSAHQSYDRPLARALWDDAHRLVETGEASATETTTR